MLLYILEDSKIIGSETGKFAVFPAILEDRGLVDVFINSDNQATEAKWQKWNLARGSFAIIAFVILYLYKIVHVHVFFFLFFCKIR